VLNSESAAHNARAAQTFGVRFVEEASVKKLKASRSNKTASKSAGKARLAKRTPADKQTIEDLAAANRILYAQSVLDGYATSARAMTRIRIGFGYREAWRPALSQPVTSWSSI